MNPLTWAIWVGVAVAAITLTRNPLYLLLLLLGLTLVAEVVGRDGQRRTIDPIFFTAFVVVSSGLLNALATRQGNTVLLRLPVDWPLIGGPITLESLAYGMINGLALGALIAAFAAFGAAMPVGDLLRLVPRAFYPLAVVAAVALTYVPLTIRQARQVREAQLLRGHRVRGWRDTLPLLVPLLIGGLERALQLAEALAARGFAADRPPFWTRATLGAGVAAVFAGVLLRAVWGQGLLGAALIALGAGAAIYALRAAGRGTPRTHYRAHGWGPRDALALAGAGITLAALLLPWPGRETLFYTPYLTLRVPPFDPIMAAGLLGLLGAAGDAGEIWTTKDMK